MLQNKCVVASRQQLSTNMQGESVILNLESGMYFGLSQVGARIWELIQQPISVQGILQAISAEYDVEPERCEQDIQKLLEQLSDSGLVEVIDAENS